MSSLLLEISKAVINKLVIEIFTTKMGMTIGSFDLEDTVFNGKKGNIESTTSKVEDEDVLLLFSLFIKTISDSGGSWLVDNSKNVDTRDLSSILGSLSLRISEISWDSNDGIVYCFTEVSFGDLLHLDEDHG
jgi:hypothetical protein